MSKLLVIPCSIRNPLRSWRHIVGADRDAGTRHRRDRPGRRRRGWLRHAIAGLGVVFAALALSLGTAQDASAQCTPTENFDNLNGANVNTNSSLSGGSANSQVTVLNIGAAGGDGSYGGDCVLFVDTGILNIINVDVAATTTFMDAIVLERYV